MSSAVFRIGHREITADKPTYVIAELSANHNQSFSDARELVKVAYEVGADAVKLQTYTADTLTLNCRNAYFQIGEATVWKGKNLYDIYSEAYTPWEWQATLKKDAEELGMHCFSSPFDFTAVEFLEQINVPAYKIASFEMVDIALIEKVASTGKPTIMSTGMATQAEILEAVQTFRKAGGGDLALLKCTSSYPAPPEEMNLRTISDMSERFGVVAGLSDHSMDTAVAVTAVALGARIIEKHITLTRSVDGPDSSFSLEPDEFREMIAAIRTCEKAMGQVQYTPTEREMITRRFRRSLFVVRHIKAGEKFDEANIRSIRPGDGLHTRYLREVIGSRAVVDIEPGDPLSLEHLEAQVRTNIGPAPGAE